MILQTEAGGGEREAVGRETGRPESRLAGQPRRLHAPVHQVGDVHAPVHQVGDAQDGQGSDHT